MQGKGVEVIMFGVTPDSRRRGRQEVELEFCSSQVLYRILGNMSDAIESRNPPKTDWITVKLK